MILPIFVKTLFAQTVPLKPLGRSGKSEAAGWGEGCGSPNVWSFMGDLKQGPMGLLDRIPDDALRVWTGAPGSFAQSHQRYAALQTPSATKRKSSLTKYLHFVDFVHGFRVERAVNISQKYPCYENERCFLSARYRKGAWEVRFRKEWLKLPHLEVHRLRQTHPTYSASLDQFTFIGPQSVGVHFTPIAWGYWWKFPDQFRYSLFTPIEHCRGVAVSLGIRGVPDGWVSAHTSQLEPEVPFLG